MLSFIAFLLEPELNSTLVNMQFSNFSVAGKIQMTSAGKLALLLLAPALCHGVICLKAAFRFIFLYCSKALRLISFVRLSEQNDKQGCPVLILFRL